MEKILRHCVSGAGGLVLSTPLPPPRLLPLSLPLAIVLVCVNGNQRDDTHETNVLPSAHQTEQRRPTTTVQLATPHKPGQLHFQGNDRKVSAWSDVLLQHKRRAESIERILHSNACCLAVGKCTLRRLWPSVVLESFCSRIFGSFLSGLLRLNCQLHACLASVIRVGLAVSCWLENVLAVWHSAQVCKWSVHTQHARDAQTFQCDRRPCSAGWIKCCWFYTQQFHCMDH